MKTLTIILIWIVCMALIAYMFVNGFVFGPELSMCAVMGAFVATGFTVIAFEK